MIIMPQLNGCENYCVQDYVRMSVRGSIEENRLGRNTNGFGEKSISVIFVLLAGIMANEKNHSITVELLLI